MRTRSCLLFLWLSLAVSVLSARAKVFDLPGGQMDLAEVTSSTEVYYQSMRFNRASNQWNFEVVLRNTAVAPLRGPVVLLVDGVQGSTGALGADGRDEDSKAYYILSSLVPEVGLPTGQTSTARTLALGATSGTPRMTARVFARGTVSGPALAFVRTLNEVGQPLPGVRVAQQGPTGDGVAETGQRAGVATLGRGEGTNLFKFSKDGYLPVWRRQLLVSGVVSEVPSPRLVPRADGFEVGPAGGVLTNGSGKLRLQVPAGAFSTQSGVWLTPLQAQTLPGMLPAGWSPLQAFWVETSSAPALGMSCQIELWGTIATGETAALVRWNDASARWEVATLIPGNGAFGITVQVPGAGAYAVAVADVAPGAPPGPFSGQPLPGVPPIVPDYSRITITSTVNPSTSAPSKQPELVTATAYLTISNAAGPLNSGTLLRGRVTEVYQLRDGTLRVAPSYETWFVGYRRPGNSPAILNASFPLRPQLLFGPDELVLGTVTVDVLPPTSFAGAVFTSDGGDVASGTIRLSASSGVFTNAQAAQLAELSATNFASLQVGGVEVVRAFQLTIDDLGTSGALSLGATNLQAGGNYVLARVLSEPGVYGLEPVARYTAGFGGQLLSAEPATGVRLAGLDSAGQYVLAKVSGAHAILSGVGRNSTSNAAPGMVVRSGPWATRAGQNGSYLLIGAANSSANVTFLDLGTGETAGVMVSVPAGAGPVQVPDQPTASVGPRIVSVAPGNGSTNVSLVTSIVVNFSKPLNPGSAVSEPIVLRRNGTNVPGTFNLSLRGDQLTLLPDDPLTPVTAYSVAISTNLADASGKRLVGEHQFTFETADVPFLRDLAAQFVIHEPTNGLVRMRGTAGFAEPGQPVVLLNETSGRTTTVLANADGSFDSQLAGDDDDELSVTVVNQNGSRDRITPNRQVFADGSIGIFGAGGTIEVAGETGVTEFVIEPGAIASRTKFKIEAVPMPQVLNIVSNVQPENGGKILGGFKMGAIEGPQLSRSMDVRFPVNLSQVLPPGVSPTNCGFGLCIARLVDGERVFELVDRMVYEDGKLVTHSPPFFGLLGPYEDILVMPLLMFVNYIPMPVHGQAYAQEWDAVNDVPIQGAEKQLLPGALVVGRPAVSPITQRGRMRPGAVYAVAGSEGKFTLILPANVDTQSPFVGIEATHPRFPGVSARTVLPELSNGDRFVIGNVITRKNVVFPIVPQSQFAPPVITVSHTPENPEPLRDATISVLISAADTPPEVDVTVESVQPLSTGGPISRNDVIILAASTENLTPRTTRQTFRIKSAKAGLVLLRIHTLEVNGSTAPVLHPILFGATSLPPGENPPVADVNDRTGPRVIAMVPSPGSKGHLPGDPIQIVFNEAIRREILQQPLAITITPTVKPPRMELSPDQRELVLDIPDLVPGTNYTITLGFYARDLNDNALDQDPSAEGNQPFVGNFTPAPLVTTNVAEIVNSGGVSAILRGSVAYFLERQGTARGRLVVMDVSKPASPVKLGEYSVPQFPRDMVFIPAYSYMTTNAESALSPYHIKRADITNVVTSDIVAIVGGLSGLGQYQWLRLLDVTDPRAPKWLGGTVVGFDGITLPGRLRWSPPILGYMETGTPDLISLVNLQAFIIGQLLIPNQDEYRRLPSDGDPGLDLDGDGMYVSPGEELPLPAHFPLDYAGKVAIVSVADTTQGLIDFAIEGGGAYIGAVLDHGFVRGTNGLADVTQPLGPTYRTIENSGLELPRELAALEITNGRPRRMATLFHYTIGVSNVFSTRDLVLVSVRGEQTNYLNVIDITDRLAPKDFALIPLAQANANESVGSIILRSDGLLAVAADTQMFLLDPRMLASPFTSGHQHPAIVSVIPGVGGFARSFGSETTGVHVSADVEGKATIAQSAPRLSFVRFPEDQPFLPSNLNTNSASTNASLFSRVQFVDFIMPGRLREEGFCDTTLVTNLDARTHYYVLLEAPGGAGPEIEFAIESLNEAGRPLRKKGVLFPPVHAMNTNALAQLGQAPGTNDAPVRALTAWRVSNDPSNPFYNFYLSRPFVALAEEISKEDIATLRQQLDREFIWSGPWIRASIDPKQQTNTVLGPFASSVDLGERVVKSGVEKIVDAYAADLIPSPNPGPAVGEMLLPTALESVSAHNRELVINTTDLALPGRRMPIEFRRTYRGQSLYEGIFGRGWDFNFNQRLVVNPLECLTITARKTEAESDIAHRSDLLFYNGGGEVVIYRFTGTNAPSHISADPLIQQLGWIPRIARYYMPPQGLFAPMFQFKDGRYVRLEPDGKQYWFNSLGRLEKIYDRYDRNAIELIYNDRGELTVIFDELRRKLELGYYRAPGDPSFRGGVDERTTRSAWFGKVCRLKDYSGRDCLFNYDDKGLLISRQSPLVTTAAEGSFTGRQEVTYTYSSGAQPTRSALSLTGLRGPEPGGVPAVTVSDLGDQGRDTVREIAVGGKLMRINASFPNTAKDLSENGGRTTVQNSDGSTSEVALDQSGRATNAVIAFPGGSSQTNRQEFYTNGLIKAVISAEGDRTEFFYDDANASFRSRGNLVRIRKVPGHRGGPVLEAATQYDSWYNLPAGEKTDFNGVSATLVLRSDHRDLERVTRAGERELFGVNEFGQIESHTSIDGIVTSIQYDAGTGFVVRRKTGNAEHTLSYAPVTGGQSDPGLRGKPSEVRDPDQIVTRFLHNELDQVVSEERDGLSVRQSYDAVGNVVRRVTKVEQQRDVVEEMSYLPMGFLKEHRVKNVETADGLVDLVTAYEPDPMYRVAKVTLPAGETRHFFYDHLSRLQVEWVPGSHTNVFSYDGNGNNTAISHAGVLEQYVYDGHDRRIGIRAANGSYNEFIYDGNGNVRTNRIIDSDNRLLSETRIDYDGLNRARDFAQVRDAGLAHASIGYNAGARTMTVTDARGASATTHLDEMGRPRFYFGPNVQVAFTNDLRGNLTGKSTREADGTYSEAYKYNARNQLEAIVDSLGNESRYTLELDGRAVAITDREQHTTRKAYTLLGETKNIIKANEVTQTNAFSTGRNLAEVSDRLGNTMRFKYDGLERLITNRLPNGAETVFENFTAQDQPRRIRMPRGITVDVAYDYEGKMTNRVVTMGNSRREESVAFDGLRRPSRMTDPAGTTEFLYDLGGFVKEVNSTYKFTATPRQAPELAFSIRQDTDLANFRSELTYADGAVKLAYGRDISGRLLSLQPSVGSSVVKTQSWVGDTRVGTRILGNGVLRMEQAFDGLRRLTGRRYVRGSDGRVLADIRYAYDKNGAILARQNVHRGGRTDLFHYDAGFNLLRADVDARPAMDGVDPETGFPGFAVPEGVTGAWRAGTYARSATYTFADTIQILSTINPLGVALAPMATNFGSPDAFLCATNIDGFSRKVDEIGNVTRTLLSVRLPAGGMKTVPADLVYNDLGLLVRVERADGVRIYNEYNQAGLRIRRTVTGDAALCEPSDRSYIYDGIKLIEERDLANGALLLRRYYYADDGDELVAFDVRSSSTQFERYYVLADHQRSVVGLADNQGNPVERIQYDPWGQPRIEAPDASVPVVSSIIRTADGLRVSFTEAVLPVGAAGELGALVQTLGKLSDALVLRVGGSQVSGQWVFDETNAVAGVGATVRFVASGTLSGSADVVIVPSKLRDEWGNTAAAAQLTVDLSRPAGTQLFAGAPAGSTGPSARSRSVSGSELLFHGQLYDWDSGLLYCRARFYDPFTGAFLQRDPSGYEDSVNQYAGFANNPVNFRDPTGASIKETLSEWGNEVSAVGREMQKDGPIWYWIGTKVEGVGTLLQLPAAAQEGWDLLGQEGQGGTLEMLNKLRAAEVVVGAGLAARAGKAGIKSIASALSSGARGIRSSVANRWARSKSVQETRAQLREAGMARFEAAGTVDFAHFVKHHYRAESVEIAARGWGEKKDWRRFAREMGIGGKPEWAKSKTGPQAILKLVIQWGKQRITRMFTGDVDLLYIKVDGRTLGNDEVLALLPKYNTLVARQHQKMGAQGRPSAASLHGAHANYNELHGKSLNQNHLAHHFEVEREGDGTGFYKTDFNPQAKQHDDYLLKLIGKSTSPDVFAVRVDSSGQTSFYRPDISAVRNAMQESSDRLYHRTGKSLHDYGWFDKLK